MAQHFDKVIIGGPHLSGQLYPGVQLSFVPHVSPAGPRHLLASYLGGFPVFSPGYVPQEFQ